MQGLVVSTPRRTAVRVWRYVLAAPVVMVMCGALVVDPRRIGEVSDASEMPLGEFGAVAGVVTALLIGVWALSELRLRTPVLVAGVLVVWLGGSLYLTGVRVEVSWWDVAEEAFLLTVALLLAVPRARGTAPRREPSSRSTDELTRVWMMGAAVVGLVLFPGVRLVQALLTGDPPVMVAGLVSAGFWAWLTWRLVLVLRPGSTASEQPRFWLVSAAGYATFLVLAALSTAWRQSTGDDRGGAAWIGTALVGVLALTSLLAWRNARRRQGRDAVPVA